MLEVKKLTVGSLSTNCYLVYDEYSKEAVIIDPGDDADYILRIIGDLGIIPEKIIATHGHVDHILAVFELKNNLNVPFLINKSDKFLVKRMQVSAKYFLGFDSGPSPQIDSYLEDGDSIRIGTESLKVILTPGHTPGSISLYSKKSNFVIVGDLMFSKGQVGRTDFNYSNFKKLLSSIRKIAKLGEKTKIFPGHGNETSLQTEIKYLKAFLNG